MFSQEVIKKISAIADDLGVEPAALLAVAEVESAGVSFWNVDGKQMPAIRFEGHYFHRILSKKSKAKLKKAVAAGLANPKAGAVKNPTSYSARYALLDQATAIDEDAALESTSWGLGQVMGSHWKKLGYASVQDLVKACKKSVDGQVEAMAAYIRAFDLIDELQSKGFLSFALQYNGPAAKKNRYAEKITVAYNRWKQKVQGTLPQEDNAISEYQTDLKTLGYYNHPVDGKDGPRTKAAMIAFQTAQGLVADGMMGPNTRDALDKELSLRSSKQADKDTKAGGTVMAAGGLGQFLVEQVNNLIPLGESSTTIRVIIGFVTVVGVAFMAWGLYKGGTFSRGGSA